MQQTSTLRVPTNKARLTAVLTVLFATLLIGTIYQQKNGSSTKNWSMQVNQADTETTRMCHDRMMKLPKRNIADVVKVETVSDMNPWVVGDQAAETNREDQNHNMLPHAWEDERGAPGRRVYRYRDGSRVVTRMSPCQVVDIDFSMVQGDRRCDVNYMPCYRDGQTCLETWRSCGKLTRRGRRCRARRCGNNWKNGRNYRADKYYWRTKKWHFNTCNYRTCAQVKNYGSKCDLTGKSCDFSSLDEKIYDTTTTVSNIQTALQTILSVGGLLPDKYGTVFDVVSAALGFSSNIGKTPEQVYNEMLTILSETVDQMKNCIDSKITKYTEARWEAAIGRIKTNLDPKRLKEANPQAVYEVLLKPNTEDCEMIMTELAKVGALSWETVDVLLKVAVRAANWCMINYAAVLTASTKVVEFKQTKALKSEVELLTWKYTKLFEDLEATVKTAISFYYKSWNTPEKCGYFNSHKRKLAKKVDDLRKGVLYPIADMTDALSPCRHDVGRVPFTVAEKQVLGLIKSDVVSDDSELDVRSDARWHRVSELGVGKASIASTGVIWWVSAGRRGGTLNRNQNYRTSRRNRNGRKRYSEAVNGVRGYGHFIDVSIDASGKQVVALFRSRGGLYYVVRRLDKNWRNKDWDDVFRISKKRQSPFGYLQQIAMGRRDVFVRNDKDQLFRTRLFSGATSVTWCRMSGLFRFMSARGDYVIGTSAGKRVYQFGGNNKWRRIAKGYKMSSKGADGRLWACPARGSSAFEQINNRWYKRGFRYRCNYIDVANSRNVIVVMNDRRMYVYR